MEFYLPAAAIELRYLDGRIRLGIGQRRHQHQTLRAEAALGHVHAHSAQAEPFRQSIVGLRRHPLRAFLLAPPDAAVAGTMAPAAEPDPAAPWMHAHDDVDAACLQTRHVPEIRE